jgi:hypothetical protein
MKSHSLSQSRSMTLFRQTLSSQHINNTTQFSIQDSLSPPGLGQRMLPILHSESATERSKLMSKPIVSTAKPENYL